MSVKSSRLIAATAITAVALLSGCTPSAGAPTTDATSLTPPSEVVVTGHVRVDSAEIAPADGWAVRCVLSADPQWMVGSSPSLTEEYPRLTAGHGEPGARYLLLEVSADESWYGDEKQATKIEFGEDGLRVSGKMISGTDYEVTAAIDIDLPCGVTDE